MATQKQTAVQTSVLSILGRYQKEIAAVVPESMTAKRMLGLVVAAFYNTPKLNQCQPMSVLNAVVKAASMGVEIRDQSAYLIPFGTTCQLVLDYRVKIMLAQRNPNLRFLSPTIVYPQDHWEHSIEDGITTFKHIPATEGERPTRYDTKLKQPPQIKLVYLAAFKDGRLRLEWMNLKEIEDIRIRSKAGTDGPWITDWTQMAKKTVVHRMFHYLGFDPTLEYEAAAYESQQVDTAYETREALPPAFAVKPEDWSTTPSEPQRKPQAEADPPNEEEMAQTQQETLAREAGQNPKGGAPQQGDLGTTR